VIFQTISIGLAVSFGNEYSNVVFSLFLIIVVLLLPEGLIGLAKRRKPVPSTVEPAGEPKAAAP
jgi:hypothetical protein